MINIETKLKFRKHIWNNYSDGQFEYCASHISYSFELNGKELEMTIGISTERQEEISTIFIEIVDFLFLACGTMPVIVYYKEDDVCKDVSKLPCRYFPSEQFYCSHHLIDINDSTLNETTLKSIKDTIRSKPFGLFHAFTALTSKGYENIYSEHKITLLLHCFEGYIYNKGTKYQSYTFKESIKEIINTLFQYDKNYDIEILKTLSTNENEYLNILKDTRHQFSHYICKSKSLNTGQDYLINFVLLHYIFRIYLLKEINIVPKEDNIKEFLYSVYDWINSLKDNNFKNYKSVVYSTFNSIKTIFNI